MIDFFIAGTFKAASSTLGYEMAKHPDIFIPKLKDPHFYLGQLFPTLTGPPDFLVQQHNTATYDRPAFEALYENAGQALKGDTTPLYLYCHNYAIRAIQADNPQARIIIILRDPADRAFSNYNHNVKDGFETRSFAECIDSWEEIELFPLHPFFHYVRAGFYDAQVAAWQAAFADVKVVTYEQVVTDVHLVLNEIAAFLEIEANFKPRDEIIQLNKSGLPRYPALHRFIMQENPVKSLLRPIYRSALRDPQMRKRVAEKVKNLNIESQGMASSDRARLNALYASEIARVSDRLGLDLAERWGL